MPMSPGRNGKRNLTYTIDFTLDEWYIINDALTHYREKITDKLGLRLVDTLINDLEILAEEDAE